MIRERWCLGVTLCLSLAACSKPEYKITIPTGKNFTISMPCQPKPRSETSTFKDYIVQSQLYQCHGLDYAYVITYSEYPVDIYKEYSAEELLADVVKHVEYAEPPFQFISKKAVDIGGVKGVEIRSRILSPRALYKSIIFYAGDGIYQVAYSAKKEKFETPQVEAFYASMRIARK